MTEDDSKQEQNRAGTSKSAGSLASSLGGLGLLIWIFYSAVGLDLTLASGIGALIGYKRLLPFRVSCRVVSSTLQTTKRLLSRPEGREDSAFEGINGNETTRNDEPIMTDGGRTEDSPSTNPIRTNPIPSPDKELERLPTYVNIGGYDDLCTTLRRRHIWSREDSTTTGQPTSFEDTANTILFTGAPGIGKTLFAKATAGELGWRVSHVSLAEVREQSVNQTIATLHNEMREAEANAPCVVILESLEVFYGNTDIPKGVLQSFNELLAEVLEEVDDNVLVIGTLGCHGERSPLLDQLFAEEYHIEAPSREDRRKILSMYLDGVDNTLTDDELGMLVDWTHGFAPTHLKDLVSKGQMNAAAVGAGELRLPYIEQALTDIAEIPPGYE